MYWILLDNLVKHEKPENLGTLSSGETEETVPKETKTKLDLDEIRDRPRIQEILKKLEKESETFKIPKSLVTEVRSYAETATLVPRKIDINDRNSVDSAQEALQEIQAKVDRILQILLSSLKFERVLGKLELLVKQDLARAGILDHKVSGTAGKQLLGIVIPELVDHQNGWQTVRIMVQQVQQHLGDAKDAIRLQIKLDENSNWSRRYSG